MPTKTLSISESKNMGPAEGGAEATWVRGRRGEERVSHLLPGPFPGTSFVDLISD
jgi:hypothetical protein